MRNFLRSIFATALVALLAASGVVSTDAFAAPKAHGGNFDGSWSVVINTLRGDCGSGLRYGVRIVGGRVVGENGGYSVGGAVPTGAFAAPRAHAGNFDGSWSVVINTVRGDCGSGLRYGVRIVGGRVVSGDGNYSVGGAVAPSGAIHVTVAEGGRSASGTGRLSGNSGSGVWRTSTGECYGNWAAARHAGY